MPAVGQLLSEYRKRQHISQMDLALLADVSSRHISFIETGRSNPSRAMLLRLAEVLGLPHRDCNLLLNSGGFSAAYSELDLDCQQMQEVRNALQMILDNHNPFPALVMDSQYNLLMANSTQQRFMSQLLPASQLSSQTSAPLNILEIVFDQQAMRPLIANWDSVASHLLRRLRRQVLAYGRQEHAALFEQLLNMQPPADWQVPENNQDDGPMLTVDFKLGDVTLSVFSTLSQFGSALDIGVEEILIESYFPADETSRQFFLHTDN